MLPDFVFPVNKDYQYPSAECFNQTSPQLTKISHKLLIDSLL